MELSLQDHTKNTRTTLKVEADPILIGRDDSCEVVIRSPFVARRHARIFRKGNQFFVDAIARAGTRVANREVVPGTPAHIDFGDEVQIAQYTLALMRPGARDADGADSTPELQRRLMAFEQVVHGELVDRLNLRVTAGINKKDPVYVAQILASLEEILVTRVAELDAALLEHCVRLHLHRLVTAEVVRQCQGRLQTDYRADERLLDSERERAITELVASMVDVMPLIFDPASVTDDLNLAEESFDNIYKQFRDSIPRELRRYIVRRTVSKDVQDIMLGLGPLQDLLEMPNVSEIMVVGKDRIYIEKNGVIQPTTRSFFSDEVLTSIVERILTPVGRRVDHSTPLVDARLLDGSRVNVIISPLSLVGPCITIRKFGWVPFTIDDLIERGSISEPCAVFLQGCVTGRKNIVISGGTGSGKTTLLNCLSAHARPNERIVTIEESAELKLPQPHVISLEGRPANIEGKGAYTIRELVRNALRMRPDRIIVGEVRGPEALDMLQAMNTGHDGSLSTLHSNNPADAMQRLETLVLMAVDMPIRAIREQIVSAIDLVVQIARFADGKRRVTHITEVAEIDRETHQVRMENIFVLRDPQQPRLRHTGYLPTFAEELIKRKIFDVDVFL